MFIYHENVLLENRSIMSRMHLWFWITKFILSFFWVYFSYAIYDLDISATDLDRRNIFLPLIYEEYRVTNNYFLTHLFLFIPHWILLNFYFFFVEKFYEGNLLLQKPPTEFKSERWHQLTWIRSWIVWRTKFVSCVHCSIM